MVQNAEVRIDMWNVLVSPKSNKQKLIASIFWLSIAAACVVIVVYAFPPLVHDVIEPFANTIRRKLSPAEVALVVIVASALLPLVFLTTSPFVWLAAMVLGIPWAILVTIVGSIFGMLFPFLIARYLLQKPVLTVLEKRRSFESIIEVLKRAGTFKVVFLLRIGPAPYSVLSYAAGIPSHVGLTKYMVASFLGQVPFNVMDVWFGKNLKGIADLLQGKKMDTGQLLYNLIGLLASVAIAVGGYWYGRQALKKIREERQHGAAETPDAEDTCIDGIRGDLTGTHAHGSGPHGGIVPDGSEAAPGMAVVVIGQPADLMGGGGWADVHGGDGGVALQTPCRAVGIDGVELVGQDLVAALPHQVLRSNQ